MDNDALKTLYDPKRYVLNYKTVDKIYFQNFLNIYFSYYLSQTYL